MLFCYLCIYVIIIYNYFFRQGVEFFSTPEWKNNFQLKKNKLLCSQQVRLCKVENFSVCGKISQVDSTLKGTCRTSQSKKYRKLWRIDRVKFAQGWKVVLLIDPNDIHKKISCLKFVVTKCLLSKAFQQRADEIYTSIWVFYDCLKPLADPMSPHLSHSFSME